MEKVEIVARYVRILEKRVKQLEEVNEIQNIILREVWDSMQYNQRLAIETERRNHPTFPPADHRKYWNPFPGKKGE